MFVDDAAVAERVGYAALVDAIAAGLEQSFTTPERSILTIDGSADLLLNMPTWSRDHISTKTLTFFPGNTAMGRPSTAGCISLFDRADGHLIGVVAASELTFRRTAAVSALAARHLAREDAATLLVIGSGSLAPHLALAHAMVRSYDRILLWGRSEEKAEAMVRTLRKEGLPAVRAESLAAAQREAHVIATATTSTKPLVEAANLEAGTHVSLVGAFTPEMRESDSATIASADVWIDCPAASSTAGDLVIPVREGAFDLADIRGDLAGLIAGSGGSAPRDRISVFKTVGFGALDLIAAVTAMKLCRT